MKDLVRELHRKLDRKEIEPLTTLLQRSLDAMARERDANPGSREMYWLALDAVDYMKLLMFKAYGVDITRGKKVFQSAKRGHKQTHGSDEEKRARYDDYQQAVNMAMDGNPALSYTEACKLIARRKKVHFNTIINHTKNPRK